MGDSVHTFKAFMHLKDGSVIPVKNCHVRVVSPQQPVSSTSYIPGKETFEVKLIADDQPLIRRLIGEKIGGSQGLWLFDLKIDAPGSGWRGTFKGGTLTHINTAHSPSSFLSEYQLSGVMTSFEKYQDKRTVEQLLQEALQLFEGEK